LIKRNWIIATRIIDKFRITGIIKKIGIFKKIVTDYLS
jgi:hypothetical protein